MGLFGVKKLPELENGIREVSANMANNYKDAAQQAMKALEASYQAAVEGGRLSEKQLKHYEPIMADFRTRLKGYTHADQKPYWTKEDRN